MFKKNGFTLVELLVVIGVVAALAAILFPVFAHARRDAHRATSISNLRQCGLILTMYCDDYGGFDAMPSAEVADQILQHAPTCDPEDRWRSSCKENYGSPLVGSYGYVRGVPFYADPQMWRLYRMGKSPTLLASIFYADNVSIPIRGDSATYTAACGRIGELCALPNRVVRLRLDGSVATIPLDGNIPGGLILFSWTYIFEKD